MKAGVDDANQFDELVSFITAFARAEHRYGGYSYETELFLSRIIRKLGLNSEIFATPGVIEIALWRDDASEQTLRLAVTRDSGRYDLNKIAKIHDVVEKVINSQISIGRGLELLKEIERAQSIYGKPLMVLAFVLTGLGFAGIIGVSWIDVLLGGLLSLTSYGFILLVSRATRLTIITELLAAAAAGFLATVFAILLPGLDPLAITVAAVVWFVPGYGLTIAPREILVGNTLSGLTYLTNAVVVAIKLVAGALAGIAVAESLLQAPATELLPAVDPIWAWAAVPVLCIGLGVLFKVTPKYLVLILFGSWLVWAGVQAGNVVGFWEGTFLGAMILAVFAKLSANRLGVSSVIVWLPLIMILVPGYAFLDALYMMGVQGLAEGGFAEGFVALFQVGIIIVAIIAGIFVGDSVVSADFSRIIRGRPLLRSKSKRGKSYSEKTA